jgi:Co/Zn/Cd efflux system component
MRDMNDKTEGIIVILAAFFVLFSAMIDPMVSAVIAIGILSCIGIWKISNK